MGPSLDLVCEVRFLIKPRKGFLVSTNWGKLDHTENNSSSWEGTCNLRYYLDGDLVISSSDHPAVSGHPCVARQQGQIGVNCKIYQEAGSEVLLIPINERSMTQSFASQQLMWAQRVLCSVRLSH